jgi:hypothetical protein
MARRMRIPVRIIVEYLNDPNIDELPFSPAVSVRRRIFAVALDGDGILACPQELVKVGAEIHHLVEVLGRFENGQFTAIHINR